MPQPLSPGLYEQLLDEALRLRIAAAPELRAILRRLDDEAAPHAYAQFIAQLLQQALRQLQPVDRLPLLNRLIDLLAAQDGLGVLVGRCCRQSGAYKSAGSVVELGYGI